MEGFTCAAIVFWFLTPLVDSDDSDRPPFHGSYVKKGEVEPKRLFVPLDKKPWNVTWDDYKPPFFSKKADMNSKFVDRDDIKVGLGPRFNAFDHKIDRRSLTGKYMVVDGVSMNPQGRTGLEGRGMLYRYGPNHFVNVIITRWKRDKNEEPVYDRRTDLPIVQVMAQRTSIRDIWTLPGKMVFPGDSISATIIRLYTNYIASLDALGVDNYEMKKVIKRLRSFFYSGTIVFTGIVNDRRNTDNAWVETVVKHYHCEKDDLVSHLPLRHRQDSPCIIRWLDFNRRINWIDKHNDFLKNIPLMNYIYNLNITDLQQQNYTDDWNLAGFKSFV